MTQKVVNIRVWDLPVRVFHWLSVLLLAGLWWTADQGEMDWHQLLAYSLLILLIVRIIWGVVGSDTARFTHFVHSPKRVIRYLQKTKQHGISTSIGHNPVGGYMVVTLITLMCLQLLTGLFATDEVFTEGPLFSLVSTDSALWLTWLHKKNFDLILVLAVIHILAVGVHIAKGDKILGAMFSGYKRLLVVEAPSLTFVPVFKAIAIMMIIAAVVVVYLMLPIIDML
ncbi:cytochrome b/b6 domain-containing protein [Shewanella youngdeokensis]|uniref:Cytochrome b/b6 domain-containing protein n=1 Tax=Shewanella youngdeokensis TaxID=2999068 RepID=A0ABZ0JXN4_9GAMM|nr:cytochrome b/b6 domain-containing protein [Shewanella sp. DAU334]